VEAPTGQRFAGKVVLITGAARGQGRSHAIALAREGARVALVDIASGYIDHPPFRVAARADLEESVRLVEAEGAKALALVCDVRDEDQLDVAVARTVAAFGGIDHVIANAGVESLFIEPWKVDRRDWDEVLAINLTGAWLTCKAAIPRLIERGAGTSIVLVASGAALRPLSFNVDYTVSKFGVVGLGLTLANDLGAHGVRVNVICPGSIDTPMLEASAEANNIAIDEFIGQFRGSNLLMPGLLRAEESTTPAVLWLLSDEARYITGVVLPVDAGSWIRTVPKRRR
jgi:NAD(P)-dependent dehydrogenase (short-subunit alcohol dehydrogenase family)